MNRSHSTRCTCFRARKLARLLSQRYDRELAPAGLTVNQFSILRHAARGEHNITALAKELGMERSTLSRELAPMVACGWIDLVAGPDARRREVRITETGAQAVHAAEPAWRRTQRALGSELGDDLLKRLHDDLDAVLRQLDGAPAR